MALENKLKHLEFIQAVINRMAVNSFLLKGWSVTLAAALFALAAKDSDKRYALVAYLPIVIFWLLDAYFLYQERLFRSVYNDVRSRKEDDIDFSMDTNSFRDKENSLRSTFFSKTLLLFYVPVVALILVMMCSIT